MSRRALRTDDDYAEAVYDHLRESGDVGDEVVTDIHPWLMRTYSLTAREAARIRRRAMVELRRSGRVERLNVRGRRARIVG
jgi:hypothetical protein